MADTPSKPPVAVLEYEPSAFEQTLLKHKGKLILVGILALAGTAGYWGYRLYKEATHKSAALAFTRAETVEELKAVAEKHHGQAAAGDALVLAAENLSADRPADAIGLLKDFLSKHSNHALRPLAEWRIAEYHARAGDMTSAEQQYDEVAKANTPYSAFALLRLGDLKWGAGDSAKAQEYYDLILKSGAMSGSPVRSVAQNRVDKALKVKPPVMVEYIPPLLPPPVLGPGAPGPVPPPIEIRESEPPAPPPAPDPSKEPPKPDASPAPAPDGTPAAEPKPAAPEEKSQPAATPPAPADASKPAGKNDK